VGVGNLIQRHAIELNSFGVVSLFEVDVTHVDLEPTFEIMLTIINIKSINGTFSKIGNIKYNSVFIAITQSILGNEKGND